MHRLFLTMSFTTLLLMANGQRISRHEADSLLHSLDRDQRDMERVRALLKLADFNIGKPGEEKADLDSAAAFIQSAKALNAKLGSREGEGYIAVVESYLCRERKQKQDAIRLTEKAISLLEGGSNPSLLGKAYIARSEYYNYLVADEMESRVGLVEKALAAYERAGDRERQAYCLEVLADLNLNRQQWMKALAYGKKSVEENMAIGSLNLEGPYVLLSDIYQTLEDFQQAVHYCLLALQSAKANKDTSMRLCQINYSAGVIYYSLGEEDRSIRYFGEALRVADIYHDSMQVYIVGDGLATVYNELHRPQAAVHFLDSLARCYNMPAYHAVKYDVTAIYINAYQQLRQFARAQALCDSLLVFESDRSITLQAKFDLYNDVMHYYLTSGQYVRGRELFPAFARLIEQDNVEEARAIGYRTAFRLDSAQGFYRLAILDLLKYDSVNNSMFNEKKSRQIGQYQVAYETSEKERNITVLEKEGELQKREISQSNQTRNFSIAGASLLALLLGVGISRYRLKLRKNQQLEVKQKEISAKNSQLEKLLHENEWLLREVHHRVKNNLQVVMSLLNSQSAYLQDEKALNAVLESQHRVQAMSLIHQKLYKSSNVSKIYMPEYVDDLVDYLRDSFNGGHRVEFHLDVTAVELDVVQAVPVGLILNEVITNAFKHAFPHGKDDAVLIRLVNEDGEITLFIADNGRGFPEDVDGILNNSFGRLLIHGLVEDLDGGMTVDRSNGTAYCIHFRQTVPGEKNMVIAETVLGSR